LRPWHYCATSHTLFRTVDPRSDVRALPLRLQLQGTSERDKALAAPTELVERVAEVEGRVRTRERAGLRTPHRLARERQRTLPLPRLEQVERDVVQRPAVPALDHDRVERGRRRRLDARRRARRRPGGGVVVSPEGERAHRERDRGTGECAEQQDGERDSEAPPVDPRLRRSRASGG